MKNLVELTGLSIGSWAQDYTVCPETGEAWVWKTSKRGRKYRSTITSPRKLRKLLKLAGKPAVPAVPALDLTIPADLSIPGFLKRNQELRPS